MVGRGSDTGAPRAAATRGLGVVGPASLSLPMGRNAKAKIARLEKKRASRSLASRRDRSTTTWWDAVSDAEARKRKEAEVAKRELGLLVGAGTKDFRP